MEAIQVKQKHPEIVRHAKTILEFGMGLTEPETHRTLQRFAASLNLKLDDAAEVVRRLAEAAERARR